MKYCMLCTLWFTSDNQCRSYCSTEIKKKKHHFKKLFKFIIYISTWTDFSWAKEKEGLGVETLPKFQLKIWVRSHIVWIKIQPRMSIAQSQWESDTSSHVCWDTYNMFVWSYYLCFRYLLFHFPTTMYKKPGKPGKMRGQTIG